MSTPPDPHGPDDVDSHDDDEIRLPPGSVDDTSDEDALAFCEEEGLVWVHGYGWMTPEDAEIEGVEDQPDDEVE